VARRAAAVDRNQSEIVQALRTAGATVQPLHSVGRGCPDLLVGYHGKNWLIEVKDWQASASDRKLRDTQVKWHDGWKGHCAVAETTDAALAIIGAIGLHLAGQINENERKA
jgi:hypothetical protein